MKKIFSLLGGLVIIALSAISCTFAYTQEQQEAYQWAYRHGITTQPTIKDANLGGNITRQEFSKMIVNYLENLAGVRLKSSNLCSFTDENKANNELRNYAKKACAYNIMGTNGSDFRPRDKVTRAELGTVISRVLWGDEYDNGGKRYYIYHLNALQYNGIMNDINKPTSSYAKRGEVMIILKRIYEKFGLNISMNGNQVSAYDNSTNQTPINNNTNETTNNARVYNDKIVDITSLCMNSDDEIRKVFSDGNFDNKEMNNTIDKTIKTCEDSTSQINELGDFKGDSSLKDSALLIIADNIAYYKQFKNLVPYINSKNLTDEQTEKYFEILDKLNEIDADMETKNEKLSNTQEMFAKKYGFDLEEPSPKNIDNEDYKDTYSNKNTSNYDITEEDDDYLNEIYSNSNIIYEGKDGTKYYYDDKFLNALKSTAEKKGESDLVKYLEIEAKYFEKGIDQIESLDLDSLPEMLGFDEDIDLESMTLKEREAFIKKLKEGITQLIKENENRNTEYINNLEKVIKKINNDKFGLKDKYKETKSFIEASNGFLDMYSEILIELVELAATSEDGEINDEEAMGVAFSLIGSALAYQSVAEEYQAYIEDWATNTIVLLGGELIK